MRSNGENLLQPIHTGYLILFYAQLRGIIQLGLGVNFGDRIGDRI